MSAMNVRKLRKLEDEHLAALAEYRRGWPEGSDEEEVAVWDRLIDAIDAMGLDGTPYDPRMLGRSDFYQDAPPDLPGLDRLHRCEAWARD